jgi:hypothetical protein
MPVPCAAIVHELGAAEAGIHPRGSSVGQYAAGVEYAVMWAQLVTPAPPEPAATTGLIGHEPATGCSRIRDYPELGSEHRTRTQQHL